MLDPPNIFSIFDTLLDPLCITIVFCLTTELKLIMYFMHDLLHEINKWFDGSDLEKVVMMI